MIHTSPKLRMTLRISTIVSIALFSVVALPVAFESFQSECERALSWSLKNKESLPQSLAEIAALPIAYRRAAFKLLPSDVQSRLW